MAGFDAYAEREVIAPLPPGLREFKEPLVRRERETDGCQFVLGDRDRVVEEDHYSVTSEVLEGAFVHGDQLPKCGVVGAQHVEQVFRRCRLREVGEVAQIAE